MTGSLVRAAYGAGMTVAAMLAAIGAHLPGAKRRWPTLAGRLGKLPAPERAAAQGGDAIWLHAASGPLESAVGPRQGQGRRRAEKLAPLGAAVDGTMFVGIDLAPCPIHAVALQGARAHA